METPVRVLSHTFSSIEELGEANDSWNLDWRQLDRGPLEAGLLRVATKKASFERVTFNRRFFQRGSSPQGSLTVALIGREDGEIRWCNRIVCGDDLLVFSPEGDNECLSRPGFCGSLVSYPLDFLEETAALHELEWNLSPYCSGGVGLRIGAENANSLRRRFQRLDHVITSSTDNARSRWARHELEHEILVRVLRIFGSASPMVTPVLDGYRTRAAERARNYIEAHAAETPKIQDVTRAAGVSWRSLDYAFRDLFDITPKQYLQATRLDGVRKELHRKGPSAKISEVAAYWGFWHMGQFAKDYKRQFGELPSETAKRVKRL